MNRYRIVITDNLFDDCLVEEEVFGEDQFQLESYRHLTRKELLDVVREADALMVNMADIDRELIESLEKCRIISRYGIGYDNVDIRAAAERGIPVAIVPDYCHIEVAEHAAALLLSCARRIPQRHGLVRKGHWRDSPGHTIHRIKGSVLGILGYGRTGQALHRQVGGFGFSRVLIHSRSMEPGQPMGNGTEAVSLKTLISESDYLSVHIPLNEKTHHLLDERKLMSMKPGSVLINTARGGVLCEEGLYTALTEGPLRAAALDVFDREPPDPENPLLSLDNVVLTDHEAYFSEQSVLDLKRKAAMNVYAMLTEGKPVHQVSPED
jgi:D-3-phosphoglycerate dehydrogenase / 2-oxoglutarate reductase